MFNKKKKIKSEIIKVKNASYERYEELLLRKDALKKEAQEYQEEYDRELGDLNTKVFEEKIACIEKRKAISFCENVLAIGEKIIGAELDSYIDKTMQDYKDALNNLVANTKKAKSKQDLSKDEQKKAKAIYHQIAKLIHPDMNKELANNKTIQDLWNRVKVSYEIANLEELEELKIMVNNYLESINHNHDEIEIPNVEEKIFNLIEEIKTIINTNPYQYKYILNNKELVNIRKIELNKELEDYVRYKMNLERQLEKFQILR